MVKNCGVCGQRGNEHMRMFPSNSLPLKQELWMDRLNLLPEERHRLLEGFREGLNRNPPVKSFWCDRHFDGNPDPIDRRSPTTPNPAYTPNTDVTALPQLTRQLSEVRVNDRSSIASPHHSNAQSASFPSPFRGNSASFPSPARIISETSTADNGMSTQHSDYTIRTDMYSSQETIEMDKDEDYRIPSSLPEYLLVSSSLLLSLFDRCPSCGLRSIESMDSFINGSALKLKWFCANCQEQSWSSQPRLKGRYYEGNVKLACAAHTTGLPLPRFRDCADLLGLGIPSERTLHDLLVRLILPATDNVYSNHLQLVQTTVWNTMNASRGVDVSVDGRYDSPGYSASNCTVSFIDLQTNLLFMVVNKHKKEKGIDNVSGRMEKVGVRTGLQSIQALQMKIRSVCTDNDAKIGKMMREDRQFKDIMHLLDYWHLIKGINHDLRRISKLTSCPNIKYWRRQIVNHGYHVHFKFGRNRQRGLKHWMSVLPHVTGRHAHFGKVPFLTGIKKCMHSRLKPSNSHLIKRDSIEYQELKAVIMKATFSAGFLRASPKKNTSPNENFNSIVNMYAPKSRACSRRWYAERVKLATLHFNHLALLNLLNLREKKGSCSVDVIGRESKAVKRKMKKADHEWRREVWEAVPDVIEGRLLELFMRKHNVPNDREYILAMQEEEEEAGSDDEEEEEGGEGKDGGESDVSEELGGGGYGEEVDSDHDPVMKTIDLSDAEDEESGEEDTVAGEGEEPSSGSEWDEGMAGDMALERGGRGRGRGRVRGGRGRGGHGRWDTVTQSVVAATEKSSILTIDTSDQEADEKGKEKGDGRKKKERRTKNSKDNSSSDSDWNEPPVKKGRGKGKCRIVDNKGE